MRIFNSNRDRQTIAAKATTRTTTGTITGTIIGGALSTAVAAVLTLGVAIVMPATASAGDTPIAENAKVYFIWPKDGAVVKGGKFWVRFGLRDAGIAPAGIERENTGHHHLLINTDLPPLDEEIPADRNHVHFGKGQSETRLELPKGTHTLQLLFADHLHIPHNPPIQSDRITITVP